MSYYSPQAGDYKTYGYAGDPGLFSFLGKLIKKSAAHYARKAARTVAPAGPAAGAAMGFQVAAPPGWTYPPRLTGPPGAGARGPAMPGFQLPGTGAGGRAIGPTRGSVAPVNGCCPKGYHMEKSGKPYCVRNRRRNVGNARALRRAISRVQGFEGLFRKAFAVKGAVTVKKR